MAQTAKGPNVATTAQSNGVVTSSSAPGAVGTNRKKQKRRAKQAARQAADHFDTVSRNGYVAQGHSTVHHSHHTALPQTAQQVLDYGDPAFDDPDEFEDELDYTEDDGQYYGDAYDAGLASPNGHYATDYAGMANSNTRPRKKNRPAGHHLAYNNPPGTSSYPSHSFVPPPPPPPPPALSTAASRTLRHNATSKDRIWNTSTQEERERIKEFWLSLSEEERKSLVKIEKEAVLKKMKEQQKHSCSCTVCGRKRTAIEEELEVLYDAYYEELEQSCAPFHTLPSSPRGRIHELPDDEDDEEDEEGDEEGYSDEDDEDDYSDDEPYHQPRGPADNFFNFGNSLTVKGGILTVADDLLKNDGKKFIEMMEQLAERRMQREEEAQYQTAGMTHPSSLPNPHGHNHVPPEEEEYDDEDDEDYDSQEDDYEEDDEMDTMTEEQRMEEGRRMFQIFAARMFEQRVLTAYREKVARERQQKLLEELEEESRLDVEREAKKARDAQKKKDKKTLQKQKQAEEKARKEEQKLAEEAAAKAAEEMKQEEQKRKREEQRKKKEAERKAQEEDRLRKEADKQKRLQEQRERQQEQERKLQEQKAQEKKAREEAKKKEREEREAREKEAKEKKAQEERERKEREAKGKAEKEAKERARKEEEAAQAAQQKPQIQKRPSQPAAVALPSGLLSKQSSQGQPSPHVQLATPAIPKAPTPSRPRQSSQQGSHGSSPKTPQVLPGAGKSMSPSNVVSQQQQNPVQPKTILMRPQSQQPQTNPSHQPSPQPSSPMPPIGPPPGMHGAPGVGFMGMPPGINGFPHSPHPVMPGQRGPMGHNMPMYPPQGPPMGPQYRGFPPPGSPPGMGGPNMMSHGRGFPMDAPPGFPSPIPGIGNGAPGFGVANPMHSHNRQHSASLDKPNVTSSSAVAPPSQPIARPAPIQRPSSVKPPEGGQENRKPLDAEVDDLSNHLGSSALLDDAEPLPASHPDSRRRSIAPGAPGMPQPLRMGFGASPMFSDAPGQPRMDAYGLGPMGAGNTWGSPFGPPGLSAGPNWSSSPTTGWPSNNAFGIGISPGPHRPSVSRPVAVRLMVCQACKQLASSKSDPEGYIDATDVHRQVESTRPVSEAPVQLKELLDICETEGDTHNGGGIFHLKRDRNRTLVKYEAINGTPNVGRAPGVLGEIGSPIPGHSMPAFGPRAFPTLGGASAPGF
ncbi:Stress response protein nst1 [Coniosporium tulheliwenetii]|uniref:Stress response protein nst1 n=1 Tax=Coniosporium tulheliwenetii TaxID=3383036 RepID=A0ACC2ZPL6_9PEZI|nr:Stress response protein nst1 [Cladosporium sp. JES 115]